MKKQFTIIATSLICLSQVSPKTINFQLGQQKDPIYMHVGDTLTVDVRYYPELFFKNPVCINQQVICPTNKFYNNHYPTQVGQFALTALKPGKSVIVFGANSNRDVSNIVTNAQHIFTIEIIVS